MPRLPVVQLSPTVVQLPPQQVAPVGQALPQAPQCCSLVRVLTQRVPSPLQARKPCPVLQAQRPLAHLAPAQQVAVALHRCPIRRQAAAASSRPTRPRAPPRAAPEHAAAGGAGGEGAGQIVESRVVHSRVLL